MKMNGMQRILFIMGCAYVMIGSAVLICFWGMSRYVGMMTTGIVIPLLFVALGIVFLVIVVRGISKKNRIIRHGTKYAAKIYGYVDNTSYTVNGSYPINVRVRYFDKNHVEREAILPACFDKGSGQYPIGLTIDIYEHHGEFGFDASSVRNEVLPGEQELMDDKLMNPSEVRLLAVNCPNCGASFQAATGYSNKCPYCGSYQNV